MGGANSPGTAKLGVRGGGYEDVRDVHTLGFELLLGHLKVGRRGKSLRPPLRVCRSLLQKRTVQAEPSRGWFNRVRQEDRELFEEALKRRSRLFPCVL